MNQLIKLSIAGLLFTFALSADIYAQERTVHVVSPGESLYRISVEYNVTVEEIEEWNNIVGGVIHPGDELYVSPPNGEPPVVSESTDSDEIDGDSPDDNDDIYIPTIVPNTYPPETHVHLQNILNQFTDFPMIAEVQMIQEDSEYARINLEKD
ncbi:LysM peptidoglycan-binding domain-containing protein, partial [Acinetobacter baumannii]|uniref:LysM peptidoglycan-binding domain-containing protein n=1 Tax=Acinetobacter baumannii TaxID=470 RepID=UPI001898EE6F